jgi:alkylation response protein AidB-like acyl-CoA dehydrogenase
MNFDFSADQKALGETARRFLAERCSSEQVRAVIDGGAGMDRALWKGAAELGWLGAALPEAFGGLGAGYLELCIVAEALGHALAPIPFATSIGLAAESLLAAGSEAQKEAHLPALASGDRIGAFARLEPDAGILRFEDGRLSGVRSAVPDAGVADFAIVGAASGTGEGLYLVDLKQAGVEVRPQRSLDPLHPAAALAFEAARAEPLGAGGDAAPIVEHIFDRAAVLIAFEQLGGAERALGMARAYALERYAFGRPIGSFQAVKHMLANMFVAVTLARSNCYYAAWALETAAPELPHAAATARVSATEAYQRCAADNIQVHGGLGFTWASDCHLHYRRSNALALALGGPAEWADLLVRRLDSSLPLAS